MRLSALIGFSPKSSLPYYHPGPGRSDSWMPTLQALPNPLTIYEGASVTRRKHNRWPPRFSSRARPPVGTEKSVGRTTNQIPYGAASSRRPLVTCFPNKTSSRHTHTHTHPHRIRARVAHTRAGGAVGCKTSLSGGTANAPMRSSHFLHSTPRVCVCVRTFSPFPLSSHTPFPTLPFFHFSSTAFRVAKSAVPSTT